MGCSDGATHPPDPATPTLSAYVGHVQQLSAKLPRGLTIAQHPPFVVIGQGSRDKVQRVSDRLLGVAVPRLKRTFFARDPEITDVWLLDDAVSYAAICRRLFREEPSTPYGFYVHGRRTMVMNLAMGGGTLLHELVHPFMAANFERAPAWFNEGMGSLFEATELREDELVGVLNWRLPGLKQQLRDGSFIGLRNVLMLQEEEFYAARDGDSYAAARYLLFYLQERGQLARYYREFRDAAEQDPSGMATLQRVLEEPDFAAFEARWTSWVLAL